MKKNKSWKRGLALLMAAALFSTSLSGQKNGVYAAEIPDKPAEHAEVITISDRDEFLKFAKSCRDDFYSYGKEFSLEADIDLAGTSFQGIPYFQGTLDGNGHTVSGLSLSREGSDYGLFRYVGKSGKIRNLKVSGNVELTGSAENAGGIVGVNSGILENCSFDGRVSSQNAAGGICGLNKEDGIVMQCEASGTVRATNQTGGICGLNRGILQKCTNFSTINNEDLKATLDLNGVDLGTLNLTQNVVTRNDSGGIAGRSYGTISECVNEGTVGYSHVGYNAGGIVGRQNGTVLNCVNKGTVMGRKDVGGIAGQAEPYRESEYLSEHLEKVRNDFSVINGLMHQMSDALGSVSEDTKDYVQMLQAQYEDTIGSLDREIKGMRDAVSGNNKAMTSYMDSLSDALKNLGDLGNDTISRLLDSLKSNMENAADKLGNKMESIGNILKPERPSETEETQEPTETETSGEPETEPSQETEQPAETETSREPEQPSETQTSQEPEQPSETQTSQETEQPSEPQTPSEPEQPAEKTESPRVQEGEYFSREELIAEHTGETLETSAEDTEHTGEAQPQADTFAKPTLPDLGEIESELESEKEELEDKKDQIHDVIHKDPIRYEHDGQIDENISSMKDAIHSASDNIKNLQGAISQTGDSVTDAMSNISGELNEQSQNSGDTIESMTDTINNGVQSISNDLDRIFTTSSRITDLIAEDVDALFGGGGTVFDVSSEDISKRTLGVLSGCQNYGQVEGDINAGGIAGTMNVEYDIDPELDMDFSGLTDVEVRSTTNAVLISCQNYGTVAGKKNNCGGMAGSENLGLISGCENYGTIRLENGKCLGGIAGYSDSRIDKSSVFCNLEGASRIGGIAGEGYDISGCLAIVTILGDADEMVGSIAGTVNEDGLLKENYFVENAWGGVDRVNYAGRAESCTYEEIMQKSSAPEGFRQVTVTFEAEDELLKTMQIPYGGTVTWEDVPDTEAKEDCYLNWDQAFPVTNVRKNLTISAENKRWTKSLAHLPQNGEKADFLVEGDFYDSSALLAEKTDAPQREGMQKAYAYTWELGGVPEQRTEYMLHFRVPGQAGAVEVLVCREDGWEAVKTEADGSYVKAVIPAGAAFAVYTAPGESSFRYWLAAAGAAVVLVAAVLLVKKRKKRRKASPKE